MSSPRWTAADIPDQRGRVAVVTGANSGLGFSTAYELARAGAEVVLGCRDTDRGEHAAERVRSLPGGGHAEVVRLDIPVSTC
jgi:NAD(P)-dependent dehydrogenase (short-subunit alcohol dehydrogenase family)